ncbi:MAG: M42 family peptidase [Spartobacteria bacterium]|nr:M42 family peptidase [Spartobacteria bacterium]
MEEQTLKVFKELLSTAGPSGFEMETARYWAKEAKTFARNVRSDSHGNVMATVGAAKGRRVMLAGHMDEIGLMITSVEEKGFLNIAAIGGWDPQMLQGQRVMILGIEGRVPGVIGKKPIHKIKAKDRDNVTQIDSMWIDIGAKDRNEALTMVRIGDAAVLDWDPIEMPNDLIVSRALDDRAGAFTILEAIRQLASYQTPCSAEVTAVATVQEEIGLRGAETSCYAINPDVGIAVDVTFATDHPSMDQKEMDIKLGEGPAISRGPNMNHRLFDLLVETAKENEIPYQIEAAPRGTGTDANRMQLSRGGVATALVSIPCRYMHSPCEMVSLKDIDYAARLIALTCMKMDDNTDFTLALD